MNRLLIYVCCMFFSFIGFGQQLNATISESVLYIGQPITLTYSVIAEKNDSLIFVPHKETIKARSLSKTGTLTTDGVDFEITDEFIDTFAINGKRKNWVGQYVVTAWDSGMYILPGPTIIINDSVYQFQDLTIACMLVDPIDGVDIYDIKENFADIPPKPFSLIDFLKSNWWWLTLIVLGSIVFIIIRKRNRPQPEEEEKPLSCDLPPFVEMKIDFTEPGIKGDTATNATKPAKIETGAEVRVPLFINEGDKIRIDTRTGAYCERVKE